MSRRLNYGNKNPFADERESKDSEIPDLDKDVFGEINTEYDDGTGRRKQSSPLSMNQQYG